VVCNAVFVAAIAFTNAMSSSRDKSSGTHPFSLQQALSPPPHRYPRNENQTNPSSYPRRT
jgi:hypothetical protein